MVTLNDSNYNIWKVKIEDFLYVINFHTPAFGNEKPSNISDGGCNIFYRQVYKYIRMWIDDNVLNHTIVKTDARALWIKLEYDVW